MSELNINTFNNILLKAAKDDVSKIKILEAEMSMIADMYYDEIGILLDELVEKGYDSEQFQKIKNIKANTENILEMIQKLERKIEANADEDSN